MTTAFASNKNYDRLRRIERGLEAWTEFLMKLRREECLITCWAGVVWVLAVT